VPAEAVTKGRLGIEANNRAFSQSVERRLLDYLLEEARQRGTRYVAGGKMTIPQSFEGARKSNSAPVSKARQLTGLDWTNG
jgi:hypothetical protein